MFGGPGWFADILHVSLVMDGPKIEEDWERHVIPWHPYKGHVAMYGTNSTLTGKVIVTAPDHKKIWHNGLKVQIEEYCHFADPFASTDFQSLEAMIASPGYIEGKMEFSFEVKLDSSKGYWHETYYGKSFSLRHM
eukprot:gene7535-15435_t